MEPITKDRWQQAQAAEIGFHSMPMEQGVYHWFNTYLNNFKFCNIEFDQKGKTIIEVGCADFPALNYCLNYKGFVVEPLPMQHLGTICERNNITWIKQPLEEAELPQADEIWLFNVMQHIIDPDLFVKKCKETAKVIRFFEPINYPTCEYHPHTFTIDDFKGWFGECVQLYTGKYVPGFHDADCAYGVWEKSEVYIETQCGKINVNTNVNV